MTRNTAKRTVVTIHNQRSPRSKKNIHAKVNATAKSDGARGVELVDTATNRGETIRTTKAQRDHGTSRQLFTAFSCGRPRRRTRGQRTSAATLGVRSRFMLHILSG